jgi:hypothetical protein
MTVTLLGSWAKHERAMEHYATLAVESEAYLRQVQFSAEVATTPEGGAEPQFYAEPQPPPRLGTIVGDVVHNLRSALDVAAWQLAIDHDEAKARGDQLRIQFPLTRNAEKFKKHKALPFFSEDARLLLERLQPYQPSNQTLGWLRDLSNADKHRLATFAFPGMTAVPGVEEAGVEGFSNVHVRFGTDQGHLGLIGIRAIAAAVESALQELDENFGDGREVS